MNDRTAKRCPFCGKEAEVIPESGIPGYWPFDSAQARCPDENCANEWMELDRWNLRDIETARDAVFNRGFHDVEDFYSEEELPAKGVTDVKEEG